jgi:CBS domain containing-hemolysin-like protein
VTGLLLAILVCVVGILASGLFSGAETGAYQFNRTRLRLRLAQGERRAHLVQTLTSDLTGFLVVCLVGTNLANSLVSYAATLAWQTTGHQGAELLATLTIAPVLFILGELAPKELFRRHADRLLYSVAPTLRLSGLLFYPLSRSLGAVTHLLRFLGLRGEEGHERHEERLRQAIAAGMEGGTLTAYQATLARNIMSLRSRTVGHAMVPLERVDCLEATLELEDARSQAKRGGRGRYPVYQDRRENVVGVVDLYDLVFEERPGLTIRNYVREGVRLDPDERVAEALVRLRKARLNLAVVARGDQALGIVTLKDLIEEITGELQDL